MSTALALYERLTSLGITLQYDDGQLRVRAAKGALDEALKAQLQQHKSALLQLLSGEGENIPASDGQTRLWLWQQQHGGDAYHLALGLELTGVLDAALFCQALHDEIAQHPALRMRLVESEQGLRQRSGQGLPAIDVQPAPSGMPHQWLNQLAAPLFDLANDLPLRVQLLRVAEHRHVLLLVFHHSVIDGWSLGIVLNNVAKRYQGDLPAIESLPVYRPAVDTQQADAWWETLLQDAAEPISFAPAVGQPLAGHLARSVNPALWSRLTALAERSGVSLHHWMNAAFQLLLAKYYAKNDIVVLTPYANRNVTADARRVGFLVNTLYSRAAMQPTQTLRELVLMLARQAQESLIHSHASYHNLHTRYPHAASNIMFSLESDAADQLALAGIDVSVLRYLPQQAKFDLMLTVVPGVQPQCLFEYRHGALAAQDVAVMAEAYIYLLAQIADSPDAALQTFRLQKTLGVVPMPSSPVGPLEQIARQVREMPQAVAVARGSESWSYAQLWAKVGRVAQWLHQQGVQPGSTVGICLPAGPDSLAATLGVFAAGSAYVPLDRQQPAARLEDMMADAGLALVIDEQTMPTGEILDQWQPREAQPINPAWLIFTSGSSGRPKAAVVHHAGVARLLAWYQQAVGGEAMRALVISNPSFDLTQKNLFAPLMCGGQVLFPCMDRFDPLAVLEAIVKHQVTVINCTPTAFISLLQEAREQEYAALDSLRHVVLGGEPVLLAPLRQWQQSRPTACRFINSYGPTECADVVAWHLLEYPLTQQQEPVPLGRAIPGALLSVVDQHGQLLPAGVSGELMIDGDSVGLGYHQRPDITARQFLSGGAGVNQRRYLTGDRAVLREDGNLYYLGRSDRQIKLNGYRIEIEEIEAALLATGWVDEVAVVLREDAWGHALLAAFYCSARSGLTEAQLHDALALRLPHYQVPARYVPLAAMPLTRSGKIDRNALPHSLPLPDSTTVTGTLNNDLERHIAEIWQILLDCPINHREADFFASGGHSLLAMEVVRQIRRQLGIAASTGLLMQHPRLADFAAALALLPAGQTYSDPRNNHDPHAAYPLSAMQQRLWFLWRMHGANSDYSMSATWCLDGELDTSRLQQALTALAVRHAIIGSRLIEYSQGPHYQLDADDGPIVAEEYQIDEAKFPAFRQQFHTQPLDLACDRFIRFALVQTAPARHYLLVNLHHIAADGLSLPILLHDLQLAWQGLLPAETAPQFAWLEQQRKASYPLLRERWKSWLADAPQTSRFPADALPDSDDTQDAGMQALSLAPAQWHQLWQQARQWGMTPFVLLLSSWFILLQRYSRQQDLVLGIPVALRDDPESAAVIGPLLNTIPLRVHCDGSLPLEQLVRRVATAFDQAMSGSALPFEEIVEAVNPLRDIQQSPLFQIQIVEDPVSLDEFSLSGLTITACPALSQQAKYDLNVHFQTQGAAFGGYIAYRQSLYGEKTIARLAQAWQQLVSAMLKSPGAAANTLSLLSAAEFSAQQREMVDYDPSLPTSQTLHGLFEAQVERTPRATALVWEGRELSYAELDAWANQLAHGLIASGLASGECVSVCLPRSSARVAVLYGVLKAGGIYLPVDPHWPAERQLLVREQAQPAQHIDEQRLLTLAQGQPVNAVERHVDAQQCCYLMYTSGSTGIPKGVPVRHGGVAHDLLFLIRRLALGEGDRVLQLTSFSFDPAVRDQFATLASGAAAILPDDATATHPARILALIAEQRVSHILSMVPTLLRALLVEQQRVLSLRVLMLNGERLRGDDLTAAWRAFGSHLTIINQYGPTEATMTSATHIATTQDENALTVPLGIANPNTQLLIMDEEGLVLPQGAVGEICIAGPGLSPGYLGQRSPHAFVSRTLPDGTRQRFYRSGDLGRWRSDGVLAFFGRIDFQVKLRGNRIELGEIDACLGQLPEIRHCAVTVVGDERNPVLAAWIAESAPGAVQAEAVKQALMAKLPAYMVPSCFTLLPELPLTASGKVDRRRLPQQLPQQLQRKTETLNSLEQTIAQVWQQLLELPTVPDCETNFFEMGANSLMMVQASERIGHALGEPLAVVDLFAHPTIRALSQFVTLKTPTAVPSPEVNVNAARRRAAFSQARERRATPQKQRDPS